MKICPGISTYKLLLTRSANQGRNFQLKVGGWGLKLRKKILQSQTSKTALNDFFSSQAEEF